MTDDDAFPASSIAKSKVGRAGVPSRKCNARTVIRYPKDYEDKELRHQPILDADGARQYRPCEAWAANGTEYCGNHGGSAPQTIAAAKRTLALEAENAARGLARIANDERVPPETRLKAQAQLLDRVGIRTGVDVAVETPGWQALLGEMFGSQSSEDDEPTPAEPPTAPTKTRRAKPPAPTPKAEETRRAKASPPAKPKFEGWE